MAHREQQQFCESIKKRWPDRLRSKRVLDVGSLDVNGNNRWMFDDLQLYVGVDLAPGRNVDIVGSAAQAPGLYDVVVSTEVLEHDPEWQKTVADMVSKLDFGGMLIITCAGPGRKEHGTRRRPIEGMVCTGDYYRNVSAAELLKELDCYRWAYLEVIQDAGPCDTRAVAIKK